MVDGIVEVGDSYPSKGTGERGAWFRDSARFRPSLVGRRRAL
jgi:hypothetical protein